MLKGLVIHSFPVNPPFYALAKSLAVLILVSALQLPAGPCQVGAWPLEMLSAEQQRDEQLHSPKCLTA